MIEHYCNEISNNFINILPLEGNNDVYHLFVIRTPYRDQLSEYLEQNGIQTLIHYPIPPHQQNAYNEYSNYQLPVTELIHKEILSLPISPVMKDSETEIVIRACNAFIPRELLK